MTPSHQSQADSEMLNLLGTWLLISFVETHLTTGVIHEPFGPAPHDCISFGADGRMFVLIVGTARTAPKNLTTISPSEKAELYDSLMAYGGSYELVGAGHVIFDIDISWNETWTGQMQDRFIEFSGNRLTITVGPQLGMSGQPIKATLRWVRVGGSPHQA